MHRPSGGRASPRAAPTRHTHCVGIGIGEDTPQAGHRICRPTHSTRAPSFCPHDGQKNLNTCTGEATAGPPPESSTVSPGAGAGLAAGGESFAGRGTGLSRLHSVQVTNLPTIVSGAFIFCPQ